jgi:putative ABC transport system ATP-binding protein
MDLFDRLHQEGNTVVLVTHERDIALHAHRIVSLHDGQVSSDVSRTQMAESPGEAAVAP